MADDPEKPTLTSHGTSNATVDGAETLRPGAGSPFSRPISPSADDVLRGNLSGYGYRTGRYESLVGNLEHAHDQRNPPANQAEAAKATWPEPAQ
jgi:hypothetical protein